MQMNKAWRPGEAAHANIDDPFLAAFAFAFQDNPPILVDGDDDERRDGEEL